MSLSRPVEFPLLKLPWLCIKCVIQNSDIFDIIYFTTISNRTLRIVQQSKYSLKKIDVDSSRSSISMGKGKHWNFSRCAHEFGNPLLQKRNSEPFSISRSYNFITGHNLHSYTFHLKMGIEFMIEVFGCKIGYLIIAGDKISNVFGLGINSVEELFMNDDPGPVNITDLKYLLETIKVTDTYGFEALIPANFSCDPQIFKCRKLYFGPRSSADWVTPELLCQFDVPQLTFWHHRFSVEHIVSYVSHWFNSENRKLEYVRFAFDNLSLDNFQINHLNPRPFCEKRRSRRALYKSLPPMDMSKGKDILRKDGLLATLHSFPTSVIFYVWHKRFPDAV
ncbi:unnamed protein product [Caenorhabditis brenneri]